MWNYKVHKKVVKAMDAFDVLSSEGITWLGTFQDTFKKYQFKKHDSMPTVYDMLNFIKYAKNTNILGVYEKDKTKKDDLKDFCTKLAAFVSEQILQAGSPNSDTSVLTSFLSQAVRTYSIHSPDSGIYIGGHASNPKDMDREMRNLIALRFETLNLLSESGVLLDDSCVMYLLRKDDVKRLGVSPDDYAKNALIRRSIERKPVLQNFESNEKIKKWISSIPRILFYDSNYKLLQSCSLSGLSKSDLFSYVDTLTESNLDEFNIAQVGNSFGYMAATDLVDLYLYLRFKITRNPNDEIVEDKLLDKFYIWLNKWDFDEEMAERLRKDPKFVEFCLNKGDQLKDIYIFHGFSSVEVMEEYLDKNPEDLKKFSKIAIDRLNANKKTNLEKKSNEAKTVNLRNGLSVLDMCIKDSVIKKIDAFSDETNLLWDNNYPDPELPENASPQQQREYNLQLSSAKIFQNWRTSYFERMSQEREYTSINPEDLQKYAKQMIILEFDANRLKTYLELKKIKKFKIGPVDFTSGLWRGVFVPRFPTASGNPVPAIVIRTDAYDSLEHHKQLSENLGFSPTAYTEATRRHEIAHALHYLAVGDLMMQESVDLNPELTKQEAYLMDPAELYARSHGDIPFLSKLFDSKIKNLTVSPLIYQAAKEQWLEDIVNEKIHIMSGGTNLRRLMMQDETPEFREKHFGKIYKKDGTEIDIPDPLEAVSKILSRQRIKLELMFHELFAVSDKREKRRGLISKKNRLKREIESTPKYEVMKKIRLEEELIKTESLLIRLGQELLVDTENVSTSVLKGYLKDYFRKVSEAVADGLLGPDIINTDNPDKPRSFEKPSADPTPPTQEDINDLTESIIGYSEPMIGGRGIDKIIPSYTGKVLPDDTWTWKKDPNDPNERKRPPGNFPGLEPTKPQPQSNITVTTEDPQDPFKQASVYNHRRLKR